MSDASDGAALRDQALTLLRTHRTVIIRNLTRAAVIIALEQETLTADDVRAVVPIPPDIRPVVLGAAMRDAADAGVLMLTGEYRKSVRPEAHARPLAVWKLRDRAAAQTWLALHPALARETMDE